MPIIRSLAHGESLQRRPGCCRLGVKTRGTRLRLSVCLFGTARWLTAWLRVCDAVPSVPGVLGNVELVAKNDPEARRQHPKSCLVFFLSRNFSRSYPCAAGSHFNPSIIMDGHTER